MKIRTLFFAALACSLTAGAGVGEGKAVCLYDGMQALPDSGMVRQDRPQRLKYAITAKGPGKLMVRFKRHDGKREMPAYGAGQDFELTNILRVCSGVHTVPAGAYDAIVLYGEGVTVLAVEVKPAGENPVPELMRTEDGRPVAERKIWEDVRRKEIREFFLSEIYGRRPVEKPGNLRFSKAEPDKTMLDGKAVRKRVRITYAGPGGESSFIATAFIPATATFERPAPAFLLICNRDPKKNLDPERKVKSGFWPVEQIVGRGYAAISFWNGDITKDASWDFTNGVFGVFQDVEKRTGESWGIISAWAWGASRVMDWIETEPTLNAERVAVVGHSRGGKTSLFAGVTDERFAMTCVNCSGCGGAKLNHWDLPLSEHYRQIWGVGCWFCPNFEKYIHSERTECFDAHWWMALVAPRLLAVASATEDAWAGQEGEFQAARLASPAWELYGKKGLVGDALPAADEPLQDGSVSYHIREGIHNLTPYDWDRYMDFADRNGWKE